jgi:putative Mn2+ efflux pump MntP
MAWWTLLILAAGLASDAGAVAIATALRARQVSFRQALGLAAWCALFQGAMPALGFAAAWAAGPWLAAIDHWVAFLLLAGIGGKMAYEGLRADADAQPSPWPGPRLQVALAFATSLDALIAGITLPALGLGLLAPALAIGGVTLLVVLVGALFGRHLGQRSGRWAETAGGALLILIGGKVLLDHLLAG